VGADGALGVDTRIVVRGADAPNCREQQPQLHP